MSRLLADREEAIYVSPDHAQAVRLQAEIRELFVSLSGKSVPEMYFDVMNEAEIVAKYGEAEL